jgi:hypothetical protein
MIVGIASMRDCRPGEKAAQEYFGWAGRNSVDFTVNRGTAAQL